MNSHKTSKAKYLKALANNRGFFIAHKKSCIKKIFALYLRKSKQISYCAYGTGVNIFHEKLK